MGSSKVLNNYGSFDVTFKYGKGSVLTDVNNKKYVDFLSGIAVNCLGHGYKPLVNAIKKQAARQIHICNYFMSDTGTAYADELLAVTGFDGVFFGNSGAEANEGAIKFARKYSYDKYGDGRSTIITLVNSFHGRTITTLAATGQDTFHTIFGPFTPGFKYCPANDIEKLNEMATDDVCAIMFECVQGEGGVNNLDYDFVKAIEKLANEKDILMVVDEVQTGNGRTGRYFAYENFDIKPDIVSTAKGLAGGLPMGAVLFGEKLKDTVTPGSHGSTFGGNPVCAAGAISIVSRIDDEFLKSVREKSEYIKKYLMNIKGVKSVSGMGLMLGVEIEKDAKEVANECLENGLLVLTAKTKVRLLPALNISFCELERGLKILKEVIEK